MADTARAAKRELGLSEKPDMQWRIIGGVLGLAVGFASRKVLAYAWEKATGKEPPASADSPDIGLGEAIAYAVVMGLGIEVTRIVATRAAARKWRSWKDAARDLTP